MNFDIPEKLQSYLDELDRFIEQEIKPLEEANDNIRFFDHVVRTRVLTGSVMACLTKIGKLCWLRRNV